MWCDCKKCPWSKNDCRPGAIKFIFLSCFRSKDLLQVAQASLNVKASLSLSTFVFYYTIVSTWLCDKLRWLILSKLTEKHVIKHIAHCHWDPLREGHYLFAKLCFEMNRCEVWRIIHRIFTYLNEFTVVSTLVGQIQFLILINLFYNFDKCVSQYCTSHIEYSHIWMSYTFCPRIDLEGGWCLGAQWLQLLSRPHIVHTSLNSMMRTISNSFYCCNQYGW